MKWNDSSEIHWWQKPSCNVCDLPVDRWPPFWEIKFARKLIGIQIIQPRLPNGCQIWVGHVYEITLPVEWCLDGLDTSRSSPSIRIIPYRTMAYPLKALLEIHSARETSLLVSWTTKKLGPDSYCRFILPIIIYIIFWEVNLKLSMAGKGHYHSSCLARVNHFESYPHRVIAKNKKRVLLGTTCLYPKDASLFRKHTPYIGPYIVFFSSILNWVHQPWVPQRGRAVTCSKSHLVTSCCWFVWTST